MANFSCPGLCAEISVPGPRFPAFSAGELPHGRAIDPLQVRAEYKLTIRSIARRHTAQK